MKKKWIVLAGVVVALGALVATAMAHRGERMRGHGPRAFMQQLDLTDAQKEQLKVLHEEQREKMKGLKGEEFDREAIKALHEEHRAAMGEILSEEQREKMEAMRAEFADGFLAGEHRGHRGKWGRRGGIWGGPERGMGGGRGAFARLDLSDEQKEELKGLRQAHRGEMDTLRKAHREGMEKLLTEGQREKLEEFKDEAFYGGKRRHGHMW